MPLLTNATAGNYKFSKLGNNPQMVFCSSQRTIICILCSNKKWIFNQLNNFYLFKLFCYGRTNPALKWMGLIHQDSKECQHKVALAAIPVQTLILNDSRDLEGLNQLCQLLFSQDRPEYLVWPPAIHFLWLTTFLGKFKLHWSSSINQKCLFLLKFEILLYAKELNGGSLWRWQARIIHSLSWQRRGNLANLRDRLWHRRLSVVNNLNEIEIKLKSNFNEIKIKLKHNFNEIKLKLKLLRSIVWGLNITTGRGGGLSWSMQ